MLPFFVEALEMLDKFIDDPAWRRGARGHAGHLFAKQYILIKFIPVLQVKRRTIVIFAQLGQPAGIRAVQAPQDEHDIDLFAQGNRRFLPFDGLLAEGVDDFQLTETAPPDGPQHPAEVLRALGGLAHDPETLFRWQFVQVPLVGNDHNVLDTALPPEPRGDSPRR